MPKIDITEVFKSVQGEGHHVGAPSIFVRSFLCNLQCEFFGQSKEPSERISLKDMPHMTMSLDGITSLEQLPIPTMGCDSAMSWAKRFKHLTKSYNVDELINHYTDLLPRGSWVSEQGQDFHLVITGGEPLLPKNQDFWASLLDHEHSISLRNVTFETNGTQEIGINLKRALNGFVMRGGKVTWSVSPKLETNSGEPWEKAIIPSALKTYALCRGGYLYLKFVIRDEEDLEAAEKVIDSYYLNNIDLDNIYLMPEGAVDSQLKDTKNKVVDMCMRTGYKFSPRLHVDLFGNAWMT